MTLTQQYTFLRQAGFSHAEANSIVNGSITQKQATALLNTDQRRIAYERLYGTISTEKK